MNWTAQDEYSVEQIANGMLSHLNTSLQNEFLVSRAKYNALVQHHFGHSPTPNITTKVREYLNARDYLMSPVNRNFLMARVAPVVAAPQTDTGKVNSRVCQWASYMLRLRDSFVEDFEHNRHPEYAIPKEDFERRVRTFYKPDAFDGRFKNMFRSLMQTVRLKVGFIDEQVQFTKLSPVAIPVKSAKPKRPARVAKPIAKVFNAQELFAVMTKSFDEALGQIGQLKWSGAFTHVVSVTRRQVTRSTTGRPSAQIATVYFEHEKGVWIGKERVDTLVVNLGDIVLTNAAGVEQFKFAIKQFEVQTIALNIKPLKF